MIIREFLTVLGFQTDDRKVNNYNNALKSVIRTTQILAVGTIAMGVAFLKGAGDIEQVQIAFETMLGSAEKADQLIKDITEFASKTPFELTGLIESSKKLLAFGFGADEIIEKMTVLGNISAGVGRDKLPSLILAFGKIRTKGKATMEELNIMLEAGVPILDALADKFGIAKTEVADMVSKGIVGFEDVDEALRNLGTGTGRFAGLMEKQSKSFLGIITNIWDTITNLSNAIGAELLPNAKSLTRGFLEFLQANQEIIKTNLAAFFQEVIKWGARVFLFIKKLVDIIKPFISRIFDSTGGLESLWQIFKSIVIALAPAIKGFLELIGVFADLLNIIFDVFDELDIGQDIIDALGGAAEFLGNVFTTVGNILEMLKPVFRTIIFIVGLLVKFLFKAFKKLSVDLSGIVNFIGNVIGGLIEIVKNAIGVLQTFFDLVTKFFGEAFKDIDIKLLERTIETKPEALPQILEQRPELIEKLGQVRPELLEKAQQILNVNSEVQIMVPDGTPEEQAQRLREIGRDSVRQEWAKIQQEVIANIPGVD